MANEPIITIVGNLTKDPELRYTASGKAVASFTVASTPRRYSSQSQQWEDGETLFLRCSIWGDYAEHVTESAVKGSSVIVQGRLKQRRYETRDGDKRTVYELDADEVGLTLRYATAKATKVEKNQQQEDSSTGWGQEGGQFDEAPF